MNELLTTTTTWLDYAKRLIAAGPQGGEHLLAVRALIKADAGRYPYVYRSPTEIAFPAGRIPYKILGEDGRLLVTERSLAPELIAELRLEPVLHRTAGQYLVDVADAAGVPLELTTPSGAQVFKLGWHQDKAWFYDVSQEEVLQVTGQPHVIAVEAWYRSFVIYAPGALDAMVAQSRGQA